MLLHHSSCASAPCFCFFEATPNSVSVNMWMFFQFLKMYRNDRCKHKCCRQYPGLHLNLPTQHLSPLFRAILRAVESSSSLTFTHGLREQRQVLTGMVLADPSPDLGFLSGPTRAVISVSSLLFRCIQSFYVIYLKSFSDHFHANDS